MATGARRPAARRQTGGPIAAVIATSLLVGCQSPAPVDRPATSDPAPEPVVEAAPVTAETDRAAPEVASRPEAPARPDPEKPAPVHHEPYTPADLVAMGPGAVEDWLGAPSFRRVEEAAELWQYRLSGCVLFLFVNGEAGQKRIVRAETASPREGAPSPDFDSCLQALADGRTRPADS
ncbi:hypothetical protein [Oceanibacterium hippocampi]|uniref:Uncharacterized protein n=1 Tax=Oceanibacterium hippocampi TaxID=745714 RepID=A0A1Y5RID3_9PROT|nr:hypothetical protein [Oceanibacterium hippocampi]SLN18320.1 hypothetical protein OCH7691_00381 [Oceanibacterium hippocampi]